MKRILSSALGLLIIAAPLPGLAEVTAQTGAEPSSATFAQTKTDGPFGELASALASEQSMEDSFRILMDVTMPKMFLADENIAILDIACPGTVDAMMGVVEPVMRPVQERGYEQYRRDLTDLFSAKLSAADAAQAAAFYQSELGRKYVAAVVRSSTLERSIDSAMAAEDSAVSIEALNKDTQVAALRGMFELSPDERRELISILGSAEWFKAYRGLEKDLQAIQLTLANTDLTPKENQIFEQRLEPVIEKHLDSCGLSE